MCHMRQVQGQQHPFYRFSNVIQSPVSQVRKGDLGKKSAESQRWKGPGTRSRYITQWHRLQCLLHSLQPTSVFSTTDLKVSSAPNSGLHLAQKQHRKRMFSPSPHHSGQGRAHFQVRNPAPRGTGMHSPCLTSTEKHRHWLWELHVHPTHTCLHTH